MFTESKDWDNIYYDKRENLKQPKYDEIELFDDNWREIKLPEPPKNSSPDCLRDFKRTKRESLNVTEEQKEQYKLCDKDASHFIKKYLDDNNLEYEDERIEYIEQQCVPIIRHYKMEFNRIRPYQYAKLINDEYERFVTDTAKTPSYPSGHTVQPYVVALYYGGQYPDHKEGLLKGADICAYGRVLAGLHYVTDYKAGITLAEGLYDHMVPEVFDEDAPMNSTGAAVSTDQPVVRRKKRHSVDNRIFKLMTRNPLQKVVAEGIIDDTLLKLDLDRGHEVVLENSLTKETEIISYARKF